MGQVSKSVFIHLTFFCPAVLLSFGAEKASLNWRRNRSAIGVKV